MKIHDIKQFTKSNVITAKYDKGDVIPLNSRVFFKYDSRTLTMFTTERQLVKIEIEDISRLEALKRMLTTGKTYVASILDHDKKNRAYHLVVKEYLDTIPLDFKVLLQDDFLDKQRVKKKDGSILRNYERDFIIDCNPQLAVIAIHQRQDANALKHFYLVGKAGCLEVQVKKLPDGSEVFVATRVKSLNDGDYRFLLVEGEIGFVLDSEEARLDMQAEMFFEQIKNDTKAYINIWNEYGNEEFKKMLTEVSKAGYLKYGNCEYVGKSIYKLTFSGEQPFAKFAKQIGKSEEMFSLSLQSPKEVFETEDADTSFTDRYKEFARESQLMHCNLARPIDEKSNTIFITTTEDIKHLLYGGYIFISIAGYMSMNERRRIAYDRIFKGEAGIRNISALLEGKAFPSKPIHRDYYSPLSELVVKKAFPHNPPTDKQKEAIEVALNTPDIALIQGPPGTGKTTVIVGVLERLNEIVEGEERRKAKNLVTAFQHDAVENVAERVRVLDLPTIKFGSRRSDTLNAKRVLKMNVENWISEKVGQFYEAYPIYKENEKIRLFDRIYQNYLMTANTVDESLRLLLELQESLRFDLNMSLEMQLDQLIRQVKKNQDALIDPEYRRLIQKVAGLPDHPVKFEDNGAYNVKFLIRLLERQNDGTFEEYIKFFHYFLEQEKALRNHSDDGSVMKKRSMLYKTMYDARRRLLQELKPVQNIFNTPKQRTDILALFQEISEFLNNEILDSYSEEDRVLLNYIEEYELNPIAVQNTILNYMSVIGATNQQAVGVDIKNIMAPGKDDHVTYDNVVIDEAARSNPLDLFIPISRAERRIILVGDHRQLPHIVDEKLVKLLETTRGDTDSDSVDEIKEKLQLSLFETLFIKLKEQEKKDGIKRTVTLDRQYRTHPVLGDFVSENFYEIHGEARIESGLPASYFAHKLPGLENKAAVWMNVPSEEGEEISGQSKKRPIEAKRIVEHLKEMIHSEEAKGLNFGIITFYADQVKQIKEELVLQGMARKIGEDYELLSEYAEEFHNGRVIEKLRVGTVDAFQGMEFDFVYLSMVRSNAISDKTEKQRRQKYGFLMMENRLCVSMSRQKKMLIVAGDEGMLRTPNAPLAIQPLINFYDHCAEDEQYGKTI